MFIIMFFDIKYESNPTFLSTFPELLTRKVPQLLPYSNEQWLLLGLRLQFKNKFTCSRGTLLGLVDMSLATAPQILSSARGKDSLLRAADSVPRMAL